MLLWTLVGGQAKVTQCGSQGQEQDSPIKDPTKPAVDESSPLTDVSLMEPEYPEPLIKPGSTKRPRKSVHCKRFARAAGFASRS
jgi:hypothetical protein